MLRKLNFSRLTVQTTWFMSSTILDEKSSFRMLGFSLSSKWDRDSYIVSIARLSSKKIRALICSTEFLSYEATLSICKYTIKYYCHVLAVASWVYWISFRNINVGLLLLHRLLLLNCFFCHPQNAVKPSLFHRHYLARCLSELAELGPLPYSRARFTRYSNRLDDFSVNIPRLYENFYVKSFFPGTTRLWNSLSTKCFSLI